LNEEYNERFTILKLAAFTKASTLSKRLKLSLRPRSPIKLEYSIDDITGGNIIYHLAGGFDQ